MRRGLAIAFALCLLATGCAGNGRTQEMSHTLPVSESAPAASASQVQDETISLTAQRQTARPAQAVVYDDVGIRRYEGEGAHPYVYSVITNHTDKTIVANQYGMLAYDQRGNALQVKWVSTDSSAQPAYYFLCNWGSLQMEPGETHNPSGGWSLNVGGVDPEAEKVAYVLYCDKEIRFADGTVWINPQFDDWRTAYEGKAVAVEDLQTYYPYVQELTAQ